MDEDEKEEVYTCICGGKQFTIQGGAITCISCGTIYCLTITWLGKKHGAKEFNERLRGGS